MQRSVDPRVCSSRHSRGPARVAALILTLSALLPACAPRYDGFDCELVNSTPSGATCTERGITVAQGEAMVVRISPTSESRTDYESDAEVELRSADAQLLDVRAGFGIEQTLIGLAIGETVTEVWIDGELVDEVPTEIVASQPSGPSD